MFYRTNLIQQQTKLAKQKLNKKVNKSESLKFEIYHKK